MPIFPPKNVDGVLNRGEKVRDLKIDTLHKALKIVAKYLKNNDNKFIAGEHCTLAGW